MASVVQWQWLFPCRIQVVESSACIIGFAACAGNLASTALTSVVPVGPKQPFWRIHDARVPSGLPRRTFH